MERLTKNDVKSCYEYYLSLGGRRAVRTLTGRICNELLQYKQIEEELGIDLITLFKAYHSGFHIKYEDGFRGFIRGGEYFLEIGFETLCIKVKEFGSNGTRWYFKDYGKTWALTKEELEK